MSLLHLSRRTAVDDSPAVPPEAHAAREKADADWTRVLAVRARSDRVYSQNGWIDALNRAQERRR